MDPAARLAAALERIAVVAERLFDMLAGLVAGAALYALIVRCLRG